MTVLILVKSRVRMDYGNMILLYLRYKIYITVLTYEMGIKNQGKNIQMVI